MVRVYVRKSERGKSYTKETLERAMEEVKSGIITAYKASQKYGIPMMTLNYRIRGMRGKKSNTQGRSTVIPLEMENELASGIRTMEKWGWGLSRKEIFRIVGDYVRRNRLKTPFKDGVPGEDWFLGFTKRHNFSIKKPQSVEYARKKSMDPFIINGYFQLLEKTLNDLNLLDKPQQIWNLDESGFCLDPSKTRVVGNKGTAASRTTAGPGRENITVLMAANAAGYKAPPLIIFKGKNIWDEWVSTDSKYPGTTYAATSNGWMESHIFLNYFQKSFLKEIGDARPVLLIYDGHVSHVDERLISCAMQNNVTILKLPPHSSHLLQPLDLSVFRSLKTRWDAHVVEWQRHNQGQRIPKKHFSRLIGKIWSETNPEIIASGFKKGGIFPFNSKVVSEDHYDPLALKRWELHKKTLNKDTHTPDPESNIPETSNNQTDLVQMNDNNNDLPGLSVINNPDKTSFEELLLDMVKQHKGTNIQKSRRKIAGGAEIITAPEVLKRLREKEDNKSSKKKKVSEIAEPETPSEDEAVVYDDSDDDIEEELREEQELAEYMDKINKEKNDANVNDWVLIACAGKKNVKHYIGQVISVKKEDDEIEVKFTRKVLSLNPTTSTAFTWANPEECSFVEIRDIVMVLPKPEVTKRGLHRFGISFDNYNIQ